MKVQQVKKFINASYKPSKPQIESYERVHSLSGKRAQVYFDPKTKKAIVTHKGTSSHKDIITDIKMAVGIESGKRFQHAKKIQKKAERLYGPENVTTIGHSLGGRIAEKVGKKSNKIITYNKAATPKSILSKTPRNQIDIRAKNDPVSILSKFQKKTNATVNTKGSINLLKTHGTSKLKYIRNQDV